MAAVRHRPSIPPGIHASRCIVINAKRSMPSRPAMRYAPAVEEAITGRLRRKGARNGGKKKVAIGRRRSVIVVRHVMSVSEIRSIRRWRCRPVAGAAKR